MTKEDLKEAKFKKEVGMRLKKFREFLRKSKTELAKELQVNEKIITNIENGKIFPDLIIQYYLFTVFQMNLNWLIMGSGKMIITPREKAIYSYSPKITSQIDENDPMNAKYEELLRLMNIPVIEQLMFAKLAELKIIASKEIKTLLSA